MVFLAEGGSSDTGIVIDWAKQLGNYLLWPQRILCQKSYTFYFSIFIQTGLVDNAKDSSELAKSVVDSDGIYFIPAFSGIQVR